MLVSRLHARRDHLLWLSLYLLLDLSWIRVDQFAYLSDRFSYDAVLQGTGCAPEQYRIGALFAARLLSHLLHFNSLIAGFLLIDLLCATLLSLLLYLLLLRELRSIAPELHLAAKALLGLGMLFYLHASYAFARVETLPSAVFVVLSLLLFQRLADRSTASRFLRAVALPAALVGLALLQGLLRADVAVILGLSLALAAALPSVRSEASRAFLAGVGALIALTAGLTLLYLARVVYPSAHYCGSVVQLGFNLSFSYNYLTLLTLLPPVLLAAVYGARRPAGVSLEQRTAVLAAVLYLLPWSLLGNWSEGRIIVPFAMGLLPSAAIAFASVTSHLTR